MKLRTAALALGLAVAFALPASAGTDLTLERLGALLKAETGPLAPYRAAYVYSCDVGPDFDR